MVSRLASKVEKNYAQLDLQAMAVYYDLSCFRMYLTGSPHKNVIATEHLSFLIVFNRKRSESIRTERIKL